MGTHRTVTPPLHFTPCLQGSGCCFSQHLVTQPNGYSIRSGVTWPQSSLWPEVIETQRMGECPEAQLWPPGSKGARAPQWDWGKLHASPQPSPDLAWGSPSAHGGHGDPTLGCRAARLCSRCCCPTLLSTICQYPQHGKQAHR